LAGMWRSRRDAGAQNTRSRRLDGCSWQKYLEAHSTHLHRQVRQLPISVHQLQAASLSAYRTRNHEGNCLTESMTNQSTTPGIPSPYTAMTQTVPVSTAERTMLGHNLDWWNGAMAASLILAGIFGLAAALATTMVVKLQRQVDADTKAAFDKYKLDAEKDINDAKARAANAQLALEKYKAPRTLAPEQIATLSALLKPFGKVPFDVAIEQSHETAQLLAQICLALENAGWDWQDWKGGDVVIRLPKQGRVAGVVAVSGVEIQIAESDRRKLEMPAIELINTLSEFGIPTKPRVYFDRDAEALGYTVGLLHVIIGGKGPE
jgi:hypothetical protein